MTETSNSPKLTLQDPAHGCCHSENFSILLSLALLGLTVVSPCLHSCLRAHGIDSLLVYPFVLVITLTLCNDTSHKWQFQVKGPQLWQWVCKCANFLIYHWGYLRAHFPDTLRKIQQVLGFYICCDLKERERERQWERKSAKPLNLGEEFLTAIPSMKVKGVLWPII